MFSLSNGRHTIEQACTWAWEPWWLMSAGMQSDSNHRASFKLWALTCAQMTSATSIAPAESVVFANIPAEKKRTLFIGSARNVWTVGKLLYSVLCHLMTFLIEDAFVKISYRWVKHEQSTVTLYAIAFSPSQIWSNYDWCVSPVHYWPTVMGKRRI